ncbi:hypothetical protein GCK32_012214 [Trichostrongylus colubriformis]|uniref:Uncharacterized protein n=1 Tax=Trichostrongylus colubriformis TaxID=6319 RepID=A0AAN8J1M9_TRICO
MNFCFQCPIAHEVIPSPAKIRECRETISNHAWEEQHSCGVTSGENLVSPESAITTDRESVSSDDDVEIFCGLKSRAVVILFGDGVHNFVDGIAIGASFLHSMKLGLITTIAVICHEVPHELGDLAVLVESGLSMKNALLLNLLSALTAFLGLYTSIAIARSLETRWFTQGSLDMGLSSTIFRIQHWIHFDICIGLVRGAIVYNILIITF